jgi:hypothetical protein
LLLLVRLRLFGQRQSLTLDVEPLALLLEGGLLLLERPILVELAGGVAQGCGQGEAWDATTRRGYLIWGR